MSDIRYMLLICLLLTGQLTSWGGTAAPSLTSISGDLVTSPELSERALANHFVWAAGSKEEFKSDWIDKELIGGLLLDGPVDHIDLPTHIAVALPIDEHLQLSPHKPSQVSLKTLLAIDDPALRNSYYQWFITEARTIGYDHLILPSEASILPEYRPLYEEMMIADSMFFLHEHLLGRNLEVKRKKFYEADTTHLIKVIEAAALEAYEKTLTKGPKSDLTTRDQVDQHLKQLYRPLEHVLNVKDHQSLMSNVWKQSVIAVQQEQGVLPLSADTVAIWTTNGSFASQMDLYFNTVLDARFDHISTNIPVIIDGREQPMTALDKAAELSTHPIIWIGDLNLIPGLQPVAMLYTTGTHESLDHLLPEMLYGSEPIVGHFQWAPPSFLSDYSFDPVAKQQLLGFSSPEWLQMDASFIDTINTLAHEMIVEHGTPGAQVLVAKEGKIVLQKSYGYLTYDSLMPVQNHTLYDLASLTKVTATLLATMKLNQEKQLLLDSTLGYYLPAYQNTNKAHITIRQLLAHQSGLKSYLPFWKRSLNGDFADVFYYKSKQDAEEDKRSYGYQPDPVMLDSLMGWIRNSPLTPEEEASYKYSDLGFMILHQVIESITGQPINDYLAQHFYQPLGMYATCFNPLSKGVELYDIAPTEYDYYFRDEQVWGQVHDRNAAVFGGIAGHAGLFSNARDLALLLQMMLQDGSYRDQQFVAPSTLNTFNQQYFANNRRGLGWDKPGAYNPNISELASKSSFGHTGFTGTMVWVDPEEELIFVFLSNRIFPDANNRNLIRLDTRRKMHDAIYTSLGKP